MFQKTKIKNYVLERKKPITKEVYSSYISGKLFNSKEDVMKDFKKNHIKRLSIFEVQNQNRFEIEKSLLKFLKEILTEEKISKFVEELSLYREFTENLKKWLD